MEEISSPRFITGKQLVRDLCIREKDFVMANRMLYMSVLKDAYTILNLKTQMYTKRVALPVIQGKNYILTPADYLELSSIAAPNRDGKLLPMVANSNVSLDVADLAAAKRCGCDCGCTHDYCNSLRNFETIYGTMDAVMPDNTTQPFQTLYRKIILKDGSYIEETTVPTKTFVNNVHTATGLVKQSKLICNLELLDCGCVKDCATNRDSIMAACQADTVPFECGCSIDPAFMNLVQYQQFNIDEDGDRINLPSDFCQDYVVLRYWSNSKTKDLRIPFLAKEPLMSQIKVITSTFGDEALSRVEFWKGDFKQKMDELMENLAPVMMTAFYVDVLGKFDSV